MSILTVPVTDIRQNIRAILAGLEKPVFVTQHGRVKAVLLDIEAYNDLLDDLDDARLQANADFQASVAEARAGGGKPLEDVLSKHGR
jgi:prevent-host-death family protein